jgi:UDP-glucose 4-epimerase
MNILITGGAGFIGSNIADSYKALGHEIVIIDNLTTGKLENVPKGAIFYQMDIRDEGISDILDEHKIDVINHHAAQIDVRRSVKDPMYDLSVNVLGTLNLLQAGVEAGISRFIFASTGGAIYGEQDYFPADELHATVPISPYGITKLTVEKYLHYYHLERNLTYTVLRYTNVYGPRQNPHGEAGVVAIFADKLLEGSQPIINGDGKQTRDYVYVQDVVRANMRALEMEGTDTFNVCTGVETDVNRIFELLNECAGGFAKEEHGLGKKGEQQRSVCTYKKIQDTLRWTPSTNFEEGIVKTFEFFKEKFES